MPEDSPETQERTLKDYVERMKLSPEDAKKKLADLQEAKRISDTARAMQGGSTRWTTRNGATITVNELAPDVRTGTTLVPTTYIRNRATTKFSPGKDGLKDASQQYQVESPRQTAGKGKKAAKRRLLYIRVFSEANASISQFEANRSSPRFGQPLTYRLTLNARDSSGSNGGSSGGVGLPTTTLDVHWTRCVHVTDNRSESEVYHVPRMRAVFNNILNIEKMSGASAEGYWQSCFNLLFLSTNPQLGGNVVINRTEMRNMMENISNGLQRHAVLKGMTPTAIGPSVVDPAPFIDCQKKMIANYIGIPMRVFDGSERGELASSQDDGSWNDELRRVELTHNTPDLIVPVTDRLILCNVLPEPKAKTQEMDEEGNVVLKDEEEGKEDAAAEDAPEEPQDASTTPATNRVYRRVRTVKRLVFNVDTGKTVEKDVTQETTVVETSGGYSVEWPDLESQTKKEKADVISALTTALNTYAGPGNAPSVMPPADYLTKVWEMEEDEVKDMLEAAEEHIADQHDQQLQQQQDQIDAGVVPDPTQPQGSPADQGNTEVDPEADPNANPFNPAQQVQNRTGEWDDSEFLEELVENNNPRGINQYTKGHAVAHVKQLVEGYHSFQEVNKLPEMLHKLSKADVEHVLKEFKHTPSGSKKHMISHLHETVKAIQFAKFKGKSILGHDSVKYDAPPTLNAFCPKGKGGGVDPTCGSGNSAHLGDISHESKLNLVRQKGNTHEGVEPAKASDLSHAEIQHALKWQPNMTFVVGANGPNKGLPEGTRPKLNDLERGALQKYSYKNDGPLNQHLRGTSETTQSGHVLHTDRSGTRTTTPYKKEFYDEMHHQMQSSFSKAEVLTKPIKVVRGMNLNESDLQGFVAKMTAAKDSGQPHAMQGYTSTTKPSGVMSKLGLVPSDKEIAKPFRGNVSMEIHAVHGIDMKPHTQLPAEGEFLLNHGSKMSVKSVEKRKDGGYHIILHQHPPEAK